MITSNITPNFPLAKGDNKLFSIRWNGLVQIDTAWVYNFGTHYDDCSMFFIDNNILVETVEIMLIEVEKAVLN